MVMWITGIMMWAAVIVVVMLLFRNVDNCGRRR